MPDPDSPQIRRDRITAVTVAALVCLALPTIVLLASDQPDSANRFWSLGGIVLAGIAGAVVPYLYWAPYRALGLVVLGGIGWLAAAAHGVYWNEWPGWAHGFTLGLIAGALERGQRGTVRIVENYVLGAAVFLGVAVAWGFVVAERPFTVAGYYVLAVALGLLVWSAIRFFRPLFELGVEPLLWYRAAIRGSGPGLTEFPKTGPCIVIANHACWLDPLFLAKLIPRPVTAMMTARIFDTPLIRPIMVKFGIIRVPEKAIKKDAPEIREAIAALDRGECILIYPEGYLRRTEERLLRRFGQGIWHILQARPDTPVFTCWIEGAWGSYTSYFNGPPTKNKKKDVRRPIQVGVSLPVKVPAEVLSGNLPTRTYLMNLVSAARAHIGLAPLPPFELPNRDDEKAEEPANGAD